MKLLRDEPHLFSVEQLRVLAEQFEIQFAGAQWKVEVFDDPHEGPAIYFVADVVDTYNPPATLELRVLSYLKFSGQLVWDPHTPIEPGGKEAVA
jgi:hypothetical protein